MGNKGINISKPELALIAGTRAMLGGGIGFLLADRLVPQRRKAAGWILLGIGVISTIPLAIDIFVRKQEGG